MQYMQCKNFTLQLNRAGNIIQYLLAFFCKEHFELELAYFYNFTKYVTILPNAHQKLEGSKYQGHEPMHQ